MENKKIKVSVVIPVYNTEKYVREAVESIMNQTLRELEIIIINDGSTDNSLQVVEELAAADSRIQVYSQTNQGLSMARNAGLKGIGYLKRKKGSGAWEKAKRAEK